MYKAQRMDEKNDAICLVMFTFKVLVIRMSKMARLMYFLLNTEKTDPVCKLSTFRNIRFH